MLQEVKLGQNYYKDILKFITLREYEDPSTYSLNKQKEPVVIPNVILVKLHIGSIFKMYLHPCSSIGCTYSAADNLNNENYNDLFVGIFLNL